MLKMIYFLEANEYSCVTSGAAKEFPERLISLRPRGNSCINWLIFLYHYYYYYYYYYHYYYYYDYYYFDRRI